MKRWKKYLEDSLWLKDRYIKSLIWKQNSWTKPKANNSSFLISKSYKQKLHTQREREIAYFKRQIIIYKICYYTVKNYFFVTN